MLDASVGKSTVATMSGFSGTLGEKRRWLAAIRRLEGDLPPKASRSDLRALPGDPRAFYGPLYAKVFELGLERGVGAYSAPYLRRAAAVLVPLIASAVEEGMLASSDVGVALLQALDKRLRSTTQQVVATLINAARITNRITGASSEERWIAFERLLLEGGTYREECCERFPMLEEILRRTTDLAGAAWCEFFARLSDDYDKLGVLVPGGALGQIRALLFYAGDPHNGGRSVVIVEGQQGKVVYKPRPLDTDETLARIIAWLDHHLGLGMDHLAVINRGEYGWMAFAQEADCESEQEVKDFFTRSGALMALLQVCGASDLHHENIVSVGPRPYVIDAESLFNGPIALKSRSLSRRHRAGLETVLNLSYFPALFPVGNGFLDISGVGYLPNQTVEMSRSVQQDDSSDLVAGNRTVLLSASRNLPTRQSECQPSVNYRLELTKGFELALRSIAANRSEFLERPDLLSSFGGVRSRFIPRATSEYMRIINAALHPHACSDRDRHDRALQVLARREGWHEKILVDLLAEDIRSIRNNDVPFFQSVAGSRSIWTSDGREIEGVFRESGLVATTRRLKALNAKAIDRHVRSINLTFSISAGRVSAGDLQEATPAAPATPAERIATADRLGTDLLNTAIVVAGNPFWLGKTTFGEGFSPVLVEDDLYGGSGGIGIFLAELWKATGSPGYRRAALSCLRSLEESSSSVRMSLGAFDGLAGKLFCQMAISTILDVPLVDNAAQTLEEIAALVPHDRIFDLISGSAGALLVALRARNFPKLARNGSELADACARHLLASREMDGDASTWKSSAFDTPLTGLAHGSCGIGLALSEYASATGKEDAWCAAEAAFRYAGQTASSKNGAWRDLRYADGHMCAWCHGTGGMVLARQRYRDLSGTQVPKFVDDEIAFGLSELRRTTLWSDTLCHGNGGNWEALWRGSDLDREFAERQVSAVCIRLASGDKPRGDLSEPTPDLMNGLSGIGLQLLRSMNKDVTEVATLQGPGSWQF